MHIDWNCCDTIVSYIVNTGNFSEVWKVRGQHNWNDSQTESANALIRLVWNLIVMNHVNTLQPLFVFNAPLIILVWCYSGDTLILNVNVNCKHPCWTFSIWIGIHLSHNKSERNLVEHRFTPYGKHIFVWEHFKMYMFSRYLYKNTLIIILISHFLFISMFGLELLEWQNIIFHMSNLIV